MKLVCTAFLLLSSMAWGQTTIQKLEVSGQGTDTLIAVTTSAVVTPSVEAATNPDRLVLILPAVEASSRQRNIPVSFNGVKDVRVGLNNAHPIVSRVVVDLDSARLFGLTQSGNTITLTIKAGTPVPPLGVTP